MEKLYSSKEEAEEACKQYLLAVNELQVKLGIGASDRRLAVTAADGNGNIAILIAATDGSEAARYEYGPFGEPLRATDLN